MSRSVPLWRGKTPQTAIPARVKLRIIERQDGRCACECGRKLGLAGEPIEFDHEVALINGGSHDEGNLRALRRPCHAVKTADDVAQKSKNARVRKKHYGLHEAKRKIPGSKGTGIRRPINGPAYRVDE